MKKQFFYWICLVLSVTLCGCNASKKVVYFQDLPTQHALPEVQPQPITVKAGDQLQITVFSDNPELAQSFNLTMTSQGSQGGQGGSNSTRAYTVNSKGDIKMPGLGTIHVAGLTREQIADTIENELTSRNLLRQPVVNVAFHNLYVEVLGEMTRVQRVAIEKDVLTLPELLSQCGDLTINGVRDSLMVYRQVEGNRLALAVDLRSAESMFQSPAYYLQPGDLVYVKPNGQKVSQSVSNGSAVRTPAFWISIVTFVTSTSTMITGWVQNSKK